VVKRTVAHPSVLPSPGDAKGLFSIPSYFVSSRSLGSRQRRCECAHAARSAAIARSVDGEWRHLVNGHVLINFRAVARRIMLRVVVLAA